MFKKNKEKREPFMEPMDEVREKFREQTIGYITAAFGLVAGMAWNDAIKSMIEKVFVFGSTSSIWAKFIYAAVITIILVLVTLYLNHLFNPQGKDKK
jgi:glycerol uptake facilitator-like aquaporin